jgi:hypothetical protein
MAAIVLCTLNAKWIHASFGLRCLRANLGALRDESVLVEGVIAERPLDVAERILAHAPRVVGIGVYVWNVHESEQLVAALARIAPEVVVVLGGPEVSHASDEPRIVKLADYVVRGEGEVAFAQLCERLLAGERPGERRLEGGLPELSSLASPYAEYDARDVAHRIVYVEASRGCPYECEFCLSALDTKVRAFPLARFLAEMEQLLERGVTHFKFVDRTFNLSIPTGVAILEFFLARVRPGMLLHFELIPDRLPDALRNLLARFPAGAVQLEVGIQTFDEATAKRISRRQDNAKAEANLRWLRDSTGVHLHTDLIAGLPGEDLSSFASGFDRLHALAPHEIQVGILKRLRGAPIARHDGEFAMRYAEHPPYEVLATGAIPFADMQRLRRFARVWDLVGNSGNFSASAPLLWESASPFERVLGFSDALFARCGAVHSIGLDRLARELFEHLLALGVERPRAGAALFADFQRTRPDQWPTFLAEFSGGAPRRKRAKELHRAAVRQERRRAPREDTAAPPQP